MALKTPHSTDLQHVLTSVGVELTRVGEREITGRCPVHIHTVGHEDRSPSWSINASTGLWICFSCNARGTLSMLLNTLAPDSAMSAQQFIINAGMDRLTAHPEDAEAPAVVDIHKYGSFVRVSDKRCASKNLDPDLVWRYGVRWDSEVKSWIIPIISPMGALMGWQAKKSGWVRNRPVGVEKAKTLFGVERFRSKTGILVESPLDVIRFAGVFDKPQALASFGAHVSLDQIRLLSHLCDRVIIALDNDEAGLAASKRLMATMSPPRKGIWWWNYSGSSAKDIGDMSDDEIDYGFTSATIIPPWIMEKV